METKPSALLEWRRRKSRVFRVALAPPPRLTLSEWADRYRMLSAEASAEPGKWRTDRAPYLRGIMDACSDPLTERVVVMKSAQIGGTEILNNVVGYYIDQDPAPILLVQPTLEMGQAWSKDRLAPMLRDTPRLTGKVKDPRARDSGNTLLHKTFPGGHLTVAGANSAAGLASRPIRVVLFDEVDRFPASAGSEGDPVGLATKRTATFWNRKVVLNSTPTVKGFSRIEAAFEESDRRRFHVSCPHCDALQVLRWANLKWENADPATAMYLCEECGTLIDEVEKGQMLDRGVWVAENPGHRTAGFHINALYSPWARWEELIREFLEAKVNPERLKVFVNTVLGESWEEEGERVTASSLGSRREVYPCRCESAARRAEDHKHACESPLVPAGVGVLTATIDTQGDRLELQVVGWGRGEESWLVAFHQLFGDPGKPEVWAEADAYLTRHWPHEGGASLQIAAACVDTGGHHTEMAYRFVKPRQGRKVWAIKGASQPGRPLLGRPSTTNKAKVKLFSVGTDTAKDLLFTRMKIPAAGPGYIHLPEWVDDEYLAQMTAEKVVTRYVKGRPIRAYEKTRPRNEALDLWVYSLAALVSLGAPVIQNLGTWAARLNESKEPPPEEESEEAPDPAPPPRPAPQRSRGWVNSWR